ncbi:MAG TPA: hypothetical protein VGD90_13465 [Sphingobacteriaceae bacterium]
MERPDFLQVTYQRYLRYLGLQIRLYVYFNPEVFMLFAAGTIGSAFTLFLTFMIMLLIFVMFLLAGDKSKELDHRFSAAPQNTGKHTC